MLFRQTYGNYRYPYAPTANLHHRNTVVYACLTPSVYILRLSFSSQPSLPRTIEHNLSRSRDSNTLLRNPHLSHERLCKFRDIEKRVHKKTQDAMPCASVIFYYELYSQNLIYLICSTKSNPPWRSASYCLPRSSPSPRSGMGYPL